jgi:enolase
MIHKMKSVSYRRVLNSHVEFTNEFIIELDDGSLGASASSQGETISIYEDRNVSIDGRIITEIVKREQCNVPLDQEVFDEYLKTKFSVFGRNNSFALSLAFFNAIEESQRHLSLQHQNESKFSAPAICLNVLNGGKHAYTNPVLSDFPEYLLVSRGNNIQEIIKDHDEIQRQVREKLIGQKKIVINGNLVNTFNKADNRECIEFLLGICDKLNLTDKYDLMIDASAGDLWTTEGYRFSLTDNSVKSGSELCSYWMDIIEEYKLGFLEDPFSEEDFSSWSKLTANQGKCKIIGDNLYSSDPEKIQKGADEKYTNGTIIKPNQAGTVSSIIMAIRMAQKNNQIAITSHRSISTESTYLAALTCVYNIKYIKIGPLFTDYSSVMRLNEIIRLTQGKNG